MTWITNSISGSSGALTSDAQHGNRGGGTLHSPATTLTNGFMPSTDKTKLDTVSATAPSKTYVDTADTTILGLAQTYADSAAQDEANLRAAAATLTAALDVNAKKVVNGANPADPQDLATKSYVDSAGLSPFIFRLDPTSTAQFGTPRASAGGAPTLQALTDAYARPFIRVSFPSASTSFVPLATIKASGAFRILMRCRWSGIGAGQLTGIAFNADEASGYTWYAVGSSGGGPTSLDSNVSGTAENFTTFLQTATDASFENEMALVDVWLEKTAGKCVYTYTGGTGFTYTQFQQRRKAALETAAGEGVGIFSVANTGDLDIAELVIMKTERNW